MNFVPLLVYSWLVSVSFSTFRLEISFIAILIECLSKNVLGIHSIRAVKIHKN